MSTDDPQSTSGLKRLLSGAHTWWVMPMVIGLVLTGVVLLVTDFYPDLKRFYSVF